MLKGFKDFIMRGNVIELATGVIIGSAFTAIVTALTNNLIQPIINVFGGGGDVEGLAWRLKAGDASTTIDLGAIITAVINFLIIAAVVYFIIVMPINRMAELSAKRKGQDTEEATTLSEADLLIEIRDLLAAQNGIPTRSNDVDGTGESGTAETGRHSAQ
ncbi:Large-conductance mechanosensitive channel [Corynebacterium provencense]|uniref:Large-conductance mechanosensitive channel n=1 Tax=Corynebacterium provencense TaxID=1737425 RepID=A0A2Z3YP22_9CORY|nr:MULTISPECIES: large-conductance mechanosensitive channel protein MscL [Corynebacterium]AWT25669.1 Large-conductance mechanosensitive channel [Corynebacterium provencense]